MLPLPSRAKFKNCYRLQRQFIKAEQLFTKILHEDYEPVTSTTENRTANFRKLTKTETGVIDIIDHQGIEIDEIPLKEEIETEEVENDGATVTSEPKVDSRRTDREVAIAAKQSAE